MPITFNKKSKIWYLETQNMGYVFGLDNLEKLKKLLLGS